MCRLRYLASLLLCALVVLATSGFKRATAPAERNAILISWDGALREHVKGDLAKKKLPNLARLAGEGALVDIDVTGHQTDTKAGHAQMLTGYEPALTGVYSNGRFDAIPRGYSIFERLQQAFGPSALTTIMLTAKDHNLGSQGPGLLSKAEPFHLTREAVTVWDGDQLRSAANVGGRAINYIDQYGKGRFFLFIHFKDIDANGHTHGEDSDDYDNALVECDYWLGRILEALKRKGIDDRTLVYVTADHGFNVGSKGHGHAPHIFLGSNDPQIRQAGQQRDITPTVLAAMGVDLSKITPPLPGKALSDEPLLRAVDGHVPGQVEAPVRGIEKRGVTGI
jgi:predicted AlkP superfamily pyrophosphatase or phosphodiesterase